MYLDMKFLGNQKSIKFLVFIFVVLFPKSGTTLEAKTVVLQGLDKVTARISTFEVKIGDVVRFGSLKIVPRACNRTPPEEPPESALFLNVTDIRSGGPPTSLFNGWMFASSPALNALEHPVYDVWVLECKF